MPGRFAEVIEVRPRSLRWLAVLGLGLATLTGCVLERVALDPPLKALVGVAVGLRLAIGLMHRAGPDGPDYVACARLRASGNWQLELGQDRLVEACLRHVWGDLHGPILALEWDCSDGRIRQAWLTALDMPLSSWRRLRARLALA